VVTSFAASPSWITTGHDATLKWTVTGATSVNIEGIGPVSGTSVKVTPSTDATYTLTATNQFGSTQAQTTLPVFLPPTVWFAPDDSEFGGGLDFLQLFSPDAPWSQAASHVRVFKLYTQIILDLSDAQLVSVLTDLHRRHIALAAEFGPLTPTDCGQGIEGFSASGTLQAAQRIHDLGFSLNYVAFDEPMTFGALYTGPNACQWSPLEVAQNAAQSAAQLRSLFPDVVIGDIEVVPDGGASDTWLASYEQWLDAWQQVTGTPLAFFDFDVDWGADWQPAAAALTRALVLRNIPVGHIYNGGGQSSDAAWMSAAEQNMTQFEARDRLMADEAIFQSWEHHPKHDLPETDPTSLTYLIDRYFRERTTLTLSSAVSAGSGTLASSAGPLANATVALTETFRTGTGQPGAYTYTDSVPEGTQYVVFGARVAQENCSAVPLPAEFYLTDFTLDAGAAGLLHADFTNQLTGWGIWGDAAIAQVEQNSLHIQVTPGESMGLNSSSIPFSAAMKTYTFTVKATIPAGSRGDGCAIAVFQDAGFNEITRAVFEIVPLPVDLPALQTATTGAFTFNLAARPAPFVLWASYAGSDTLWPAAAAVAIGAPPVLAIATSTLPDANAGTFYAQQLGATGGSPPYLWAAGTLPAGLILSQDGRLSGTPTTAGNYKIAVSVVDDSDSLQVADASLQLLIQ
jgi:hypothetical protein